MSGGRNDAIETIFERAATAARSQSSDEAARLLRDHVAGKPPSYSFLLDAGKLMQEVSAPQLAVPFLEEALGVKRTAQAADRLFVCYQQLGQLRDAVRALGIILTVGNYRAALRREFATVIRALEPGEIETELLNALTTAFAHDIVVGPALLTHLIAAGRTDAIATIAANGAIDARSWDERAVLESAAHLEQHGRADLALRVMCRCGGTSDTYLSRLRAMLDGFTQAQLKAAALSALAVTEGRSNTVVHGEPYVEIAERFARSGDVSGVFETLARLTTAIDGATASQFYADHRALVAPLLAFLGRQAEGEEALDRLARFAVFWLDPVVKRFFAGPDVDRLMGDLAAARVRAAAPAESRIGKLRQGYFRHHMERREGAQLPEGMDDAQFCIASLRYFDIVTHMLGTEAIPVGDDMARRLRRALMSYCAPQDATSYLRSTVSEKSIPSGCLDEAVLDEFGTAALQHDLPGIGVTRFAAVYCATTEAFYTKYDPAFALDSVLLFLRLMASLLNRNSQYRPLIAGMVSAEDSREYQFLERCIAVLLSERAEHARSLTARAVLDAVTGRQSAPEPPIQIAANAPQDVLLVGHASKSTGLGRNFRMLASALASNANERISTEELDYEVDAHELGRRLQGWRRTCRSRPIVVYAVNAQDVPHFILKDGRGDLADAYAAGFFLWETSQAPEVQRLGIDLVDEVWSPTQYVADIYAPLAPTHLIGKGLFDPENVAPSPGEKRKPNRPFRFVTVFDFDSSIERKNPLAVVLAFQAAFRTDDDVELVVKSSAINPAHWSNALGQWERLSSAMADDPRITLVRERYSDAQMESLLRDADCFVSLHRAEGFGYVIADAMAYGVPVIATDYSGNADFCTPETSFPVARQLITVDPRAMQWSAPGAEWAEPDVAAAAARMREVFGDYPRALDVAGNGRAQLLAKYSMETFRNTVLARIRAIRASS